MKNIFRSCRVFSLLFYLMIGTSSAQEVLQSFKDVVQSAVAYNKSIQNGFLESQKIGIDRDMVRGKLLPHIAVNGGYGYVNSTSVIDVPAISLLPNLNLFEGKQQTYFSTQMAIAGVTATQVIFSGMQITNGQKALEQKQVAQLLMTEAGYEQLAQDILVSFDQLMFLHKVDDLIVDSEKRLNTEHQKVVQAIANGLAIPYDRDKIKLAMLELESKKAEVESSRMLLYYKLAELTGMEEDTLRSIQYRLEVLVLNDNEATVMNRKELQALEASQRAYDYAFKKEKGAKLPQVFAVGNISYLNAFGSQMTVKDLPILGDAKLQVDAARFAPNYAVGVGVKWNVFEGKSHRGSLSKARLDMQMNANKLEDTRDKLSLLQRKTQSDYSLASKKINVYQQQLVISDNNLHLVSRQFAEGLADISERLDAENEFYKQSLGYYTQILAQRLSALEVLKANGNLYQTIIR